MRIALFVFLFCCFCSCQSPLTDKTPRFIPSNNPPVKVDGKRTPYTFGYLEVPENRQRPDSRMIRLPVYIFKSRSSNPAPDPVLYTVGGPGSSSLGAAPYMRAFQYLDDRDLILFEQRGTTYAEPHLACPEWTEVAPNAADSDLSPEERNAAYVAAAIACRTRLVDSNIDLNGYTTREIAADIEDLRRLLDIEKLNLLTVSYSTKIAQVMMRDYPGSIRSVVMDSPLPLAANWEETSLTNLVETYDALFADCAATPDCSAIHPTIKQRFRQFLDEISKAPLSLDVLLPNGKETRTVDITAGDVAGYLGELGTGDIPGFLTQLEEIMTGNQAPLRNNFSWPKAGPGNGLGMRLSVWCSEEMPFLDSIKVREEQQRYPFLAGMSPLVFSYEVCRSWRVKPEPALESQAIASQVPTLLISGSYDAVTPVKWATQLNKELLNSHLLIFQGWTHTPTTYWDNSCAMKAANTFFNNPQQKPELNCLKELKPSLIE